MDVDWISTLQMLAARMRLKLVYSESVTSVKHRLVHVVDVHVENVADLKATGRGSKKKVAKHTAAKGLYALLQDRIDRQTASKATKSKPFQEQIDDNTRKCSNHLHEYTVLDNKRKGTDREASECEKSQPDPDDCTETPRSQEHYPQQSENHTGQLQEICQQNKWPLPKYNFCFTEGPRRYACQCQLTIPLDIHACDDDCAVDATTDCVRTELHGTADSKGEAKQAAAGNTLLWLYGHKLI
ncbi:unnamed protein product [Oreochromis niloticus]|nr:unnamed protein product [Mustela putorius furo]